MGREFDTARVVMCAILLLSFLYFVFFVLSFICAIIIHLHSYVVGGIYLVIHLIIIHLTLNNIEQPTPIIILL